MLCFVREALYTYNVDQGTHMIEIVNERWYPGIGNKTKRDYIYGTPNGNWNHIMFGPGETTYESFMDSMVKKDVDTLRKMCRLVLENHTIYNPSQRTKIRLMNAIKILDPTFEPPIINRKCGWQNELMEQIVNTYSNVVISTCINMPRLERYFNIVRMMPRAA